MSQAWTSQLPSFSQVQMSELVTKKHKIMLHARENTYSLIHL